jgi:hypothetical protein
VLARQVARTLALGRCATGVACIVAPRFAAGLWLGARGRTAEVEVFARALGVRDAVIGGIALHTLDTPGIGPRWQATAGFVDAVDLAAVLVARRSLLPRTVAGTIALAGGAAAAQAWTARELRAARGQAS